MDNRLTRVAGIVLAALAAVAAWLLVFADPVVAGGYPVFMDRRVPAEPISTAGLVVAVLVAVAFAAAALLFIWSQTRGSVADVKRLAIRHEREQKHEQTRKAA